MDILFHSDAGDGVPLALRMQQEGHGVWLYLRDPTRKRLMAGLLPQVNDPFDVAFDADLVVFDMVGTGNMAQAIAGEGIPVIGAHPFCDLIELKRMQGLQILKAAGCTIPPTIEFPDGDFQQAIAFVAKTKGRYVFKADNVGTDKTHVAQGPDDMIDYLEHLDKTIEHEEHKRPPFLLQEFVAGTEVSVERWYSHGVPILGLDNITFEQKKFLNGDLGPTVGCAGNVVIPCSLDLCNPLDALAAERRFTGPIDLNHIVDATGQAFVLEPTPRFGYDAIFALLANLEPDVGEFLHGLATGEPVPIQWRAPLTAGIRVTIPPYPHHDAKESQGVVVDEALLGNPDVWVTDVMRDPSGRLVSAGTEGIIAVVTSRGGDIDTACDDVLRELQDWTLEDKQYRTDLACVQERVDQLRELGLLDS